MEGLPKQVQDTQRELDELKAQLQGDTSQQAATEQKDTVGVAAPAQVETPVQPSPDEVLKAQYSSLQGKYNAEVPRMAEHIRTLEDKIRQMEAEAATRAATPAGAPAPDQSVNRESLAAYDDEFGKLLDLVQAQRADIAALKAALESVQGKVLNVHQTQELTLAELYDAELSKLVPDHKALNKDPEFNAWLDEEDGHSGESRRTHGLRAVSARDHVKVARMYNEFKSSRKATPQPSAIPPNITPETSSSVVEPQALQQQATFSTAEVNDLYRLRTFGNFPFQWRGRWVKNDEEAAMLCAEITQAYHKGLIS